MLPETTRRGQYAVAFGSRTAKRESVDDRKREILAQKFLELGNYAIAALLFSQLVSETPNWNTAFFGALFWVVCFIIMNVILP